MLTQGDVKAGMKVSFTGYVSLLVVFFALLSWVLPLQASETGLSHGDIVNHDYLMDRQAKLSNSMVQMSDEDLSEVVASGFSSFTLEDGVARAFLNIDASTFTQIDSLKMGFYDNGSTEAWDQDWTNVSLGSSTEDLVCSGLFIEAGFSDITSETGRTLDYFRIGTPSMTGSISATFNSFSGRIENAGTLVLEGSRVNLGARTITCTDSEFYMQLSREAQANAPAGWWFFWSDATITP